MSLFKIIPNIIIITEPIIMGLIRYSKETDPTITMIGFPPAGGWVTFNSIIEATPKPTAKGIEMNVWNGTKFTKITPTKAVTRCPKKIFFGFANGLSGYPYNKTIVDPKDAIKKIP